MEPIKLPNVSAKALLDSLRAAPVVPHRPLVRDLCAGKIFSVDKTLMIYDLAAAVNAYNPAMDIFGQSYNNPILETKATSCLVNVGGSRTIQNIAGTVKLCLDDFDLSMHHDQACRTVTFTRGNNTMTFVTEVSQKEFNKDLPGILCYLAVAANVKNNPPSPVNFTIGIAHAETMMMLTPNGMTAKRLKDVLVHPHAMTPTHAREDKPGCVSVCGIASYCPADVNNTTRWEALLTFRQDFKEAYGYEPDPIYAVFLGNHRAPPLQLGLMYHNAGRRMEDKLRSRIPSAVERITKVDDISCPSFSIVGAVAEHFQTLMECAVRKCKTSHAVLVTAGAPHGDLSPLAHGYPASASGKVRRVTLGGTDEDPVRLICDSLHEGVIAFRDFTMTNLYKEVVEGVCAGPLGEDADDLVGFVITVTNKEFTVRFAGFCRYGEVPPTTREWEYRGIAFKREILYPAGQNCFRSMGAHEAYTKGEVRIDVPDIYSESLRIIAHN